MMTVAIRMLQLSNDVSDKQGRPLYASRVTKSDRRASLAASGPARLAVLETCQVLQPPPFGLSLFAANVTMLQLCVCDLVVEPVGVGLDIGALLFG